MPIHLCLRVVDGRCQVSLASDAERILAQTSSDMLPSIEQLREHPFEHGCALYHALGGTALDTHLDDDDGVILLECDEQATRVPWEHAVTDEHRFLACDYGVLRLVLRSPVRPGTI